MKTSILKGITRRARTHACTHSREFGVKNTTGITNCSVLISGTHARKKDANPTVYFHTMHLG